MWKHLLTAGLVLAAGLVAGMLAMVPFVVRLLLAAAGAAAVLAAAEKRPRWLILALFAALPFLGFLRRLLIPVAGWSGTDPLLLISPVAVVCLLGFWLVRRPGPALSTPMTRGVTLFILVAGIQMFNPLQGLAVGPIGGLFAIPPLLWYYVGVQLADDSLLERLFTVTQVVALICGLYGLYQTFFGLLDVELMWVSLAGYNSLYVGNVIRAISTFASAAEYALYLNVGSVVAVARAMQTGKVTYLLPMLIYVPALFLESSRGPVILLGLAVAVMFAIRGHSRFAVGVRFVAIAAASFLVIVAAAKVLQAAGVGGPLVEHQVGGLLNPTDDEHSTANLHGEMFTEGIVRGIKNPFGRGVGSITLACSKFGSFCHNWEVDVSNAFYALGPAGGLPFLWLQVAALSTVIGWYRRSRHPSLLIVTGILLVALGQWWNSGYYVITPMVWLLIGYVNTFVWSRKQSCAEVGGTLHAGGTGNP